MIFPEFLLLCFIYILSLFYNSLFYPVKSFLTDDYDLSSVTRCSGIYDYFNSIEPISNAETFHDFSYFCACIQCQLELRDRLACKNDAMWLSVNDTIYPSATIVAPECGCACDTFPPLSSSSSSSSSGDAEVI